MATTCIWCERTIATDAEFVRDHDDMACDERTCWCMALCWDGGGGVAGCDHSDNPDVVVRRLRAEIAELRAGNGSCSHPDHDDARFTAVACRGCQQ